MPLQVDSLGNNNEINVPLEMEFGQKLSFQKACFCTSVRCFLSKNHLAWMCIF